MWMSILFGLIINQTSVDLRSIGQFNSCIKLIHIIPSHGNAKSWFTKWKLYGIIYLSVWSSVGATPLYLKSSSLIPWIFTVC